MSLFEGGIFGGQGKQIPGPIPMKKSSSKKDYTVTISFSANSFLSSQIDIMMSLIVGMVKSNLSKFGAESIEVNISKVKK